VSFRIRSPADTEAAVALLRLSYDVIAGQLERRRAQKSAISNRQPDQTVGRSVRGLN